MANLLTLNCKNLRVSHTSKNTCTHKDATGKVEHVDDNSSSSETAFNGEMTIDLGDFLALLLKTKKGK